MNDIPAPKDSIPKTAREQITALIKAKPDKMTRRDIARALGIKGDDRRELRAGLREMVEGGELTLSKEKTYRIAGELPGVMVIKAIKVDDEGDLIGEPDRWIGKGDAPDFIIREGHKGGKGKNSRGAGGQVGVGDRALCRIKVQGDLHIAVVMKRLGAGPSTHMESSMKAGAAGGLSLLINAYATNTGSNTCQRTQMARSLFTFAPAAPRAQT